jgi:DNA-directed RNA polymerase subunit RPC12/RpoP
VNPEDAVLFPSRGDEVCISCGTPIDGWYTHVTEQGLDVIVCPGCAVAALIAAVTQ